MFTLIWRVQKNLGLQKKQVAYLNAWWNDHFCHLPRRRKTQLRACSRSAWVADERLRLSPAWKRRRDKKKTQIKWLHLKFEPRSFELWLTSWEEQFQFTAKFFNISEDSNCFFFFYSFILDSLELSWKVVGTWTLWVRRACTVSV